MLAARAMPSDLPYLTNRPQVSLSLTLTPTPTFKLTLTLTLTRTLTLTLTDTEAQLEQYEGGEREGQCPSAGKV